MALSDLTFKLHSDSGLTTPLGVPATLQLTHETDQSDNPQVTHWYFGSTETSRTLEATSNPGVDNITLTPTLGLDAWAASTAYSLGARVVPTTPNGYVYEVTVAGTSDSTEPVSWPTTVGSTVVDNSVTWTCIAAQHALTEVELSTDGVTYGSPGAALVLGTSLSSGVGNLVDVYIRVTNGVTTVTSNTSYPDITLVINEVQETA